MSDYKDRLADRLITAHQSATDKYNEALIVYPSKLGLHEELRLRLREVDTAIVDLIRGESK